MTPAGPMWPSQVFQYLGSTPAEAHTTVPTRAWARDSTRRSNREQHGLLMPHERVAPAPFRTA